MANGFCPALLVNINDVAGQNAPSKKLQIAGFLASLFCCQNSSVSPVNSGFDDSNGTRRGLTVKYRRRPVLSDVFSVDTCDVDRIPSYLEWTLPNLGFKAYNFFLPDNTVNQYCADAVATQPFGRPPTEMMNEVYMNILEGANIVMKAINVDLVTQMATQFGYNVTTNHPSGKIINVARNGNDFILDNGIIQMMQDIQENEICGDICIVGGGLFSNWTRAQQLACCSAAGIDTSRASMGNFFFDKDTQNIWGSNSVGLFAAGSVKFLGRNQYVGSFGGAKGPSYFTTFTLPVQEFGCNLNDCLRDLRFDLQLKYLDCPQNILINGVSTAVGRGWVVIVSKQYGMWVQPTTAYSATDSLANTNGTLKYFITNTLAEPQPYAQYYTFGT